jgi:O-antigen ligase
MPMTIDAKNEIDHGAKDIAAVGWGLFCILMPLGNTTLSILVFWLALMATARSPASRRALVRAVGTNRLMQATLFFVFTLFASAVFSAHRTLALLGACGYGMIALSPLLVGLLWHMPSADWLLRRGTLWLSLGGLISGAVVLYRVYALHMWRPGGVFTGSNGFASVMMLTLLITWWGLTAHGLRQPRWLRLCRLVCWLVMLWSFIVAEGRGAWGGFAVGFALYNMRSLRGVLAVVATGAASALGVRGNPRLLRRVLSILSPSEYADRLWIWQGAVAMWRDHPLVGIGPGTFVHEFESYRPLVAIEGGFTQPVSFTHNLFLGLLTEVGILGTVAFLLVLGAAICSIWKWARTSGAAPASRALVWAVWWTLVGLIVREQVDNTLFGLEIGGAFWALLAWLAVLTRDGEGEPSSEIAEMRHSE